MNVDSTLLSDYAQIDSGGKLTVVGVFSSIPATDAPVTIPQLCLSLVIHGSTAEARTTHQVEVRLLNQHRQQVNPQPLTGEFTFSPTNYPGLPLRHTYILTIYQPVFPELGPYAFEVYIDGTYSAATALYVGPRRSA